MILHSMVYHIFRKVARKKMALFPPRKRKGESAAAGHGAGASPCAPWGRPERDVRLVWEEETPPYSDGVGEPPQAA